MKHLFTVYVHARCRVLLRHVVSFDASLQQMLSVCIVVVRLILKSFGLEVGSLHILKLDILLILMKLCQVCLGMHSLYGKVVDFLCDLLIFGVQTVVMMMVALAMTVRLPV